MLSIPHLIIVFVVALVVFGPEKLPELARNLGKIMGEFKRATGDLRSTFEGHLRDLEREAEQRKNSFPAASSAAAPATVSTPQWVQEHEAFIPVPAPGTVATTPSHLLGVGTPAEGGTTPTDSSQNGDAAESPAATESQSSSSPELEQHPETLTDAGNPPA